MAIEKAKWLKEWLSSGWMNPRIFAWELSIGDWIEKAIDWVRDWLNVILWQAETAGKKAEDAKSSAVELTGYAKNILATRIDEVNKLIDAMPEERQEDIRSYYDKLVSDYKAEVRAREEADNKLREKTILTDYAISVLEREVETAGAMAKQASADLKALEGEHYNLWDLVKDFFTDPASFIYHLVDEIIERFW